MASRFTSKYLVITLEDGAANTITLGPGQGDLTIGDFAYDNAEVIVAKDRGVFDGLVEGDDLIQDWSITVEIKNESLTSGAAARLRDFILDQTLSGGALTSLDSVRWAFKVTCAFSQSGNTAGIVLPYCTATLAFSEGKETSTFSVSGKNYNAPTFT